MMFFFRVFRYVSMAVLSNGEYDTPAGLIFSFPVSVGADRTWKIKTDLSLSDYAKEKLAVTAKELSEEKAEAMAVVGAPQ